MILFLVKFYDSRVHADEFAKGLVFANRLSKFKQAQGLKEDCSGRVDPHEGTFLWGQPGRGRLVVNGMDISNDLVGPIRMQKSWVDNLHVFCMHAVHSGDVNLKCLSNSNMSVLRRELTIPLECLALGNHAVVVRNVPEFVQRMRSAARRKDFGIAWRPVSYYDPATFHGQFEDVESVFWKHNRYGFQREFRFAINSNSIGESPLVMDIGNLNDITMQFHASELKGEGWLQTLQLVETT